MSLREPQFAQILARDSGIQVARQQSTNHERIFHIQMYLLSCTIVLKETM